MSFFAFFHFKFNQKLFTRELVALKPEDFDFEAGGIHIRRHEVSSKDEAGKRCFRISENCQNDDRMHSCSVDLVLDRANKDAKFAQRSLHKIRKTVLSCLDMSMNFTVERIREIAGHSRESIILYTNYFYTIEGLEGISGCRTFEEVVEHKMSDFGKSDKLNQPLVFRRAV